MSLVSLHSTELVETLSYLVIEVEDVSNKVHGLHEILRVIVGSNLVQLIDDLFGAVFECFVAGDKVPHSLRHLRVVDDFVVDISFEIPQDAVVFGFGLKVVLPEGGDHVDKVVHHVDVGIQVSRPSAFNSAPNVDSCVIPLGDFLDDHVEVVHNHHGILDLDLLELLNDVVVAVLHDFIDALHEILH